MAAMGEPYQAWGPQTEPPEKRQRLEQLPASSYLGTDAIHPTTDILHPQWDFPTNYQQNYNQTYEEPAWSLNFTAPRPFYDPVTDSGPEYSISDDFSSQFESSTNWSVPSSYQSNDHSQPEQLRQGGDYFRPQLDVNTPRLVGNFEASPNYGEPIRSNNSFNTPPLQSFGEQLDNGPVYLPNNVVNTAQQVETLGALQNEEDVCFGMVCVSHKAPNPLTLTVC